MANYWGGHGPLAPPVPWQIIGGAMAPWPPYWGGHGPLAPLFHGPHGPLILAPFCIGQILCIGKVKFQAAGNLPVA